MNQKRQGTQSTKITVECMPTEHEYAYFATTNTTRISTLIKPENFQFSPVMGPNMS